MTNDVAFRNATIKVAQSVRECFESLIFAENRQNGENNCKTASNQFGNVVYSALCIVAETK